MPAPTASQSIGWFQRSDRQHCITDADANGAGGFRQTWGQNRGLDQLGNWSDFQEDANGDNDFSDAGWPTEAR